MGEQKPCLTPGLVVPVINRLRCDRKQSCVLICPYQVFEIRKLSAEDRARLPWYGKVKLWIHGGKQPYVIDPNLCHACGLCVNACPEKAITLQKISR